MVNKTKKKAKKKLNPLVIESQSTLADIHTKSMELVRMSRVKYEANEYTFIDLRVFQRGWGDDGEEVYHPTRRGIQLKESDFEKLIRKFDEALAPEPKKRVH
jgi:hypothetical protein